MILTLTLVTYVHKNFQIRTLIKQLLTKYAFFMKLPQISHTDKNRIFKAQFELLRTSCLDLVLQDGY